MMITLGPELKDKHQLEDASYTLERLQKKELTALPLFQQAGGIRRTTQTFGIFVSIHRLIHVQKVVELPKRQGNGN